MMKWEDPIVKEVRDVRDRIAAEHGYDIAAIGRFYQEKQRQEAGKAITLPPKRPGKSIKRA